ncbi:MAG TPA: hypothetical protein VJP02_05605 [Candidatus Sulfotelmatobacter sp.]|nr:hypothetical protein [Candidatus Sulfotelmatobacter sp.]
MSDRRLEDHIREVCTKVGHLHGAELHKTLAELRTALNEHSRRLRKIAVEAYDDMSQVLACFVTLSQLGAGILCPEDVDEISYLVALLNANSQHSPLK